MAESSAQGNSTASYVPVFKGEGYEHWSLRMKTILRGKELWDVVYLGVTATAEGPHNQREVKKKDAQAMTIIQQGVHDSLFSRIAAADSAKDTWDILRLEYQGDSQVQSIKLQGLRRAFENLSMKDDENIGDYFSRVMNNVGQQRSYGEELTDQKIVEKVLRSLSPKFDYVIPSIEVVYDLSDVTPVKLMGLLQSQEERINSRLATVRNNQAPERQDEQALQVHQEQNNFQRGRGRGRSNFRGRGRGRGSLDKSKVPQCYCCKKFGHLKKDCWYNDEGQVNVAENDDDDDGEDNERDEQHLLLAVTTPDELLPNDPHMLMSHNYKSGKSNHLWFVDSGCSNHMTGSKESFITLDESFKREVRLGDKKKLAVEGKGTVKIRTGNNGFKLLDQVYYAPKLEYNLLSVGQLMKKGYNLLFDDGKCIIKHKRTGKVLLEIWVASNNMFVLDAKSLLTVQDTKASKDEVEALKWHRRYGHLHFGGLKHLQEKNMVWGLPKINTTVTCEACILGKQSRKPFQSTSWRAKSKLELIHTDLCGPMQEPSLGKSLYYLLFIDDLTRMCWVYFITNKHEAFDKFKSFKAMIEKATGKEIKVLRSDRGGEFCSQQFDKFCEAAGIKRELTIPYTPQHNGVVERKNRTIMNLVRSMLKDKELPNVLWAEAVSTAVHVLNRSPTKALVDQTPLEAWSGTKPTVTRFKVFGCIAYGLIPSKKRRKLDSKSEKNIFIGYSSQGFGFRLYNPETKTISIKKDIEFFEDAKWDWKPDNKSSNNEYVFVDPFPLESVPTSPTPTNDSLVSTSNQQNPTHLNPTPTPQTIHPNLPHENDNDPSPLTYPSTTSTNPNNTNTLPTTSKRVTKPPSWLKDYYVGASSEEETSSCQFALTVTDPIYFDQAVKVKEWQDAMVAEMQAIERNQTWQLVHLPPGKNLVGVKWLFKTKPGVDGQGVRHKARLVAKGYSQQHGIDYQETFAPVARFETIRIILAVAAQMGWEIHQLDVKSAFLNGDLTEDIYVSQPEGFVVKEKEDMVYKLNKALYGLKQAPRAWNDKIDSYFLGHGYERSLNEPSLYVKRSSGGNIIYVCLYVDDIICTSSCDNMIKEFKQGMEEAFEMTDVGKLKLFLGLEVQQTKDGIFLGQEQYAKGLVSKFGVKDSKEEVTPMNCNEKLQLDDEADKANEEQFRSLVGGLLYLTHSRPDLAYAVSLISRFMQSPSKIHMGAAKRILKYVASTTKFGIWYKRSQEIDLVGYSDSDWASCVDDRKSISAYVFTLGTGVVSWRSKKQTTVALSSTEAEYISASGATCQALWLRRILEDLGYNIDKATVIYCDNKSAINLSKNPVTDGRTRHIDIKYHFIREMIGKGLINLRFCRTHEQVADVLTKSLSREKFVHFRHNLGVMEFESREGDEE
ncbi:hypothetical protein QVD17_03434 [Tagetes erecta]|uniref:Polyprotein n=1 Tax=Tagetes erecta TaxID=13708 RepID=A0AAD8P3D3_TARER|nr:hypothetical protein QVD17_03434 [Tagetes erecta]